MVIVAQDALFHCQKQKRNSLDERGGHDKYWFSAEHNHVRQYVILNRGPGVYQFAAAFAPKINEATLATFARQSSRVESSCAAATATMSSSSSSSFFHEHLRRRRRSDDAHPRFLVGGPLPNGRGASS
jgi:hypothetical protein